MLLDITFLARGDVAGEQSAVGPFWTKREQIETWKPVDNVVISEKTQYI